MKETKQQIVNYALNFLLSNIDETTEEDLGMTAEQIERAIENEKKKLVNSKREFEAAATLFACILGAGLIVLLALAMG